MCTPQDRPRTYVAAKLRAFRERHRKRDQPLVANAVAKEPEVFEVGEHARLTWRRLVVMDPVGQHFDACVSNAMVRDVHTDVLGGPG